MLQNRSNFPFTCSLLTKTFLKRYEVSSNQDVNTSCCKAFIVKLFDDIVNEFIAAIKNQKNV